GKTTIVLRKNGDDTSVISPTLWLQDQDHQVPQVLFEHMGCGWTEDNPIVFEQANCLVWVIDSSDIRMLSSRVC
ncbi:Os12g0632100, partial [Oryza sativa Japonica Group]